MRCATGRNGWRRCRPCLPNIARWMEPKRLAFVKNKADGAPWLFLVEAQKNRKTGLRVEPDVLISAGAALYGR